MRFKLSFRLNLYIGLILLAGIFAHFYHDLRADRAFYREMGVAEAERLAKAVFEQLHTSMRLGGGRKENRAVIERFRKIEGIEEIRVVHGAAIDAQYGSEDDERPLDAYDTAALEGRPSSVFSADGRSIARFVLPIKASQDCKSCHNISPGVIAGGVSVTVSMEKFDAIMERHSRDLFIWGLGTFLFVTAALILIIRRRFILPLEKLGKGVEAIASGDLGYRVDLKTRDEMEDLGRSFNEMAESLLTARNRLSDINEKYSKLVNMAADAIVLRNIDTGMLIDANPAASALTGYTPEELLELAPEAVMAEEASGEYRNVLRRWAYDGKGYHSVDIIKKDGLRVPVEIAASIIELENRKYVQEIWRDLTERKAFASALEKYVTELEDTVRERTAILKKSLSELEIAYRKLKESEQGLIQSAKLRSLGEMGAGIAHELNSPLAGILSIAEVLLNRVDKNDPNYFLLTKIKEAAVRSKYIILDMLTYARPAKGGFASMFLNESIRATLFLFISEIKTSSIEIIEHLDPNLPKVFGNKGQIMEVLLNIFKNARDAMKGAGKIYISTRTANVNGAGFALAEIRDTGPGIPEDIRDKIFDPFFSTKEKGGGMNIGLGLSISQSIVKEHGGRIEASNAERGGAVFRIWLPLAREEEAKA